MNSEAERIFWEKINALPEHKRTFDTDVFNAIIAAMEEYAYQQREEVLEGLNEFYNDENR